MYIQPLHKDLLFSPSLADGKVLGSNYILRFTVPGRAQMKMRQHPYGSSFLGFFFPLLVFLFLFFFNKEAYYIPLVKVYMLALEMVIRGFIHI